MRNRRMERSLLALFVFTAVVLVSLRARAFNSGVSTLDFNMSMPTDPSGCGTCHNPLAPAPTAVLVGPTTVAPGSLTKYTLDMTINPTTRLYGGLNVSSYSTTAANVGTLSLATGGNSANTKTITGYGGRTEITHTARKASSGNHVLWDFNWTAPNLCGVTTTLYAWANNVNGSSSSNDDFVLVQTVLSTSACGLLPDGSACTAGSQCTSGNCIDGFCCNAACGAQCQACDVGGFVGTCHPVTGAPHGTRAACTTDGTACGGSCDGTTISACTYPGGATQCRAPSCSAGVATLAASCTGSGSCPTAVTQACTPYVCSATQCTGPCTVDTDCITGDFCSAGICTAKLDAGTTCTGDHECASTHCVDAVCCDIACSGQCQACDVANAVGTCTTVASGAPHASHTPCAGNGTCQGTCDGTSATACTYPSAGTACAAASCTNGVAAGATVCDGLGTCQPAQTTPCGNYACDVTTCKTQCTTGADCASGATCQQGQCVATPSDAGADSGADAGTAAPGESGCSCHVGDRSGKGWAAWLAVFGALALARRRRGK